LLEARTLLEGLSPKSSTDPETLGLWGAIHKRLFELGTWAPETSNAAAALPGRPWAVTAR